MEDQAIIQRESIKWQSFFIGTIAILGLLTGSFALYKQYNQPRFATISVPKVIESQVKKFDKELQSSKVIPSDAQIQADIDKYTVMIAKTIKDYTKKNNLIVLEKGSLVSSGIVIEDMTDDFIKAISE